MIISSATFSRPLRPVHRAAAPPAPAPTEEEREATRAFYRKLEWGGFALAMLGGGLTVASSLGALNASGLGLATFVVGNAVMLGAHYKRQQA